MQSSLEYHQGILKYMSKTINVIHGRTELVKLYNYLVTLIYSLITGSSKIIRLREENSETSEILKGKNSGNGASVPVKGINNLGNTCFFNAVMQVRWKAHIVFTL